MINLLPPSIKEQIRYAKLNRLGLRYLRMGVAVIVALAGIFSWALLDISRRTTDKAAEVTDDQKTIASISSLFLPKAMDASARLNAIEYVQTSKTKYSALIADLTKVLPKGVKLDQMTLTGDDEKPVTIAVTGPSYDSILALRNGLTTSPRVSGVDINSITRDGSTPDWKGSLVVGFNPGQAK